MGLFVILPIFVILILILLDIFFICSIFFNGKIDDVAVWDEALTDAEISALYNSGETLYAKENYGDYSSKDNLVAYYTMDSDNGAGTTLTDDEGNNVVLKAHLPGVMMFRVLFQHYHLLIPQMVKQMSLSIQI